MKLYQLFLSEREDRRFQYDALDGVRGLAVLLVVFNHVANRNIPLIDGLKFAGLGWGQLGVHLFFVLSAFLLTLALIKLEEENLKSTLLWADYFVRRILRIYPLYIIVLLAILLVLSLGASNIVGKTPNFSYEDFWPHLLLMNGKIHFWTIVVEVKYYLLLPVFVFLSAFVLKKNVVKIALSTFCVSILITVYVYSYPPGTQFSVLRYLPIFLMGSLFAYIHEWYQKSERKIDTKILTVAGIVLFLLLVTPLPNIFKNITALPNYFLSLFWFNFRGILLGSFILIALNEKGPLNKLLCGKAIRFIGVISYSVYLWHWLILYGVSSLSSLSNFEKVIIFYSTTFIISCATYIVVERPLSRIRLYRLPKTHFRV